MTTKIKKPPKFDFYGDGDKAVLSAEKGVTETGYTKLTLKVGKSMFSRRMSPRRARILARWLNWFADWSEYVQSGAHQ